MTSIQYAICNIQHACQVLAAVRRGLTRHPLDLRGSRRALEAAQVISVLLPFEDFDGNPCRSSWSLMEKRRKGWSSLTLPSQSARQTRWPNQHLWNLAYLNIIQVLEAEGGAGGGGGGGVPSFVCPTLPCQLMASTILRFSLCSILFIFVCCDIYIIDL